MSNQKFSTLAEIKRDIELNLDLQEELFVSPEELTNYINDGVDECEALIHTLYEDYFLTKAFIPLVTSQSEYDLPLDIYATKIRKLIYQDGTTIRPVERIRDWHKFEEVAFNALNPAGQGCYSYMLYNPTPAPGAAPKWKIILAPASNETAASKMTMWYLRQANRLVNDTDVCDIPEFVQYVTHYARVQCLMKEVGNPMLDSAQADLEQLKQLMVDTLTGMVPDQENEIEKDLRFYQELS